jgi:Domain of Unknown Function (DUF1080)
MHYTRVAALVAALALPTAATADSPFDGKSLSGWKLKGPEARNKWKVGTATVESATPNRISFREGGSELVNVVDPAKKGDRGVDIYTEQKYRDCTIEVEFMVPKGSNSGIYVMGEYEIQILDSYGRPADKLGGGDLGALYRVATPKVNPAKKPGEWQKFVIEFQAPKFEGTKKVANARFIKVTLNDVVLHENVEMKGPTPSGVTGNEAPEGPLMFQGDHGPVAFRNIKVTPRK